MSTRAATVYPRRVEPSDELIQHYLETARETLQMDVAFVTAVDGVEQTFTHLAGDSESFGWRSGDVIPATDGYCHYVLTGEMPNVVQDASTHKLASQLPATRLARIGSYIGVPITLGSGRVYGALCVSSHSSTRDLGPSDTAFLNVLGRQISEELSRQELEITARSFQLRDLAAWLEPGGLTVLVQPIVALGSGDVKGVEALARFPGHPGNPANVFGAAGLAGIGAELELAAVREALPLLSQLPEPLFMSLNVSPGTLQDLELENLLLDVPGERIVLELSDHGPLVEHGELVHRLDTFRARGIRIAVDDAGSGYAGLQSLLALDPDIIKLDIGLVKNVDQDAVRRCLVRSLAEFAGEIGATLIAEGIETRGELEMLPTLGVDTGQGFFLAKPEPLTPQTLTPKTHPEDSASPLSE